MKKELVDIVRKLKAFDEKKSKYIDSLPTDISSAFFDNVYAESQSMQIDILMNELFGVHAEEVYWFLYEFQEGKSSGPHAIEADGTKYTFKTNEDYYEYLSFRKE